MTFGFLIVWSFFMFQLLRQYLKTVAFANMQVSEFRPMGFLFCFRKDTFLEERQILICQSPPKNVYLPPNIDY